MARTKVKSSNISEIGFTPGEKETGALEVMFSNGRLYRYDGVSKKLYDELMAAESKGSFFRKSVRNAGFKYAQIEEEDDRG